VGQVAIPSEAEQLVLLALAAGLKPERGWQSAGLAARQVAQLKRSQAARLNELRALAALGASLPAAVLDGVLKARLAQCLLASTNAAELERLAKIIERLPVAGAGPCFNPEPDGVSPSAPAGRGQNPASTKTRSQRRPSPGPAGKDTRPTGDSRAIEAPDPDADVDGMELTDLLDEAKGLIAQLEGLGQAALPGPDPAVNTASAGGDTQPTEEDTHG
jgi:hypothetical protein